MEPFAAVAPFFDICPFLLAAAPRRPGQPAQCMPEIVGALLQ
jgi:hypothetical protein